MMPSPKGFWTFGVQTELQNIIHFERCGYVQHMWMQDGKENGKKEGEDSKKGEKEVALRQKMQMNNSDLVRESLFGRLRAKGRSSTNRGA